MGLLSKVTEHFQPTELPLPAELAYMHFPCTGYAGDYPPEKYRIALTELEKGDYILCRPDSIPDGLVGRGCMIRINVRADAPLEEQANEIKLKARSHLRYLLNYAVDYERTKNVVTGEDGKTFKARTPARPL